MNTIVLNSRWCIHMRKPLCMNCAMRPYFQIVCISDLTCLSCQHIFAGIC